MFNLKLSKFTSTIIVAACTVVVIASVAVLLMNMTNLYNNSKTGFLKLSSTETPHYLSTPTIYAGGSCRVTKIFLQEATLWFDSNADSAVAEDFPVAEDTFLFIVNGTLQNNYTPTEIIESSLEGVSDCIIGLDIRLYDNQGNSVSAVTRGTPFRGFELKMKGGEEAYFEVPFVTSTRNVDYFEIYVSYLEPVRLY